MLIYDGGCPFCRSSAQRLAPRWGGTAEAVPSQGLSEAELGRIGLSSEDLASAAWWVSPNGERFRGHLAIGRALLAAGGWRALLGRLCLVWPFRVIASVLYVRVARWRRLLHAR